MSVFFLCAGLVGCVKAEPVAAGAVEAPPGTEAAPVREPVRVTYLANEGVLLESRGVRVVIDGLHRSNEWGYAVLPEKEQEALEGARAPFEGIDVLLVSHVHADHFDAEAVAAHLVANPNARLVSSPQVTEAVRPLVDEAVAKRIAEVPWSPGTSFLASVGDLKITFLGLSHGEGPAANIQNFGHLFTLGDRRILHVGDAHAVAAVFEPLGLDESAIDVAFVPFWYVTSPQAHAVLEEHIAPARVAAIHIPPADAGSIVPEVLGADADALPLTRPLGTHDL